MQTQLLGRLDIDQLALEADLESSEQFSHPAPYPEFSCGRPWRGCMLWSSGGQVGSGVINTYDTSLPTGPTVYGEQLPYLRSLIEDWFSIDQLLFARLAVMVDDVFIPHRDYVELEDRPLGERASFRLHVPLLTSDECLFIEDDDVFRMRRGEVWILDVGQVHSAAVLSEQTRIHLIMDFRGGGTLDDLVRFPIASEPGVPPTHRVDRPDLSARDRDAIAALASVIDLDNIYPVLGILTKKSYRRRGGKNFVWESLAEIARRCADPEVRAKVQELRDYAVLAREK